MSYKLTSSGVTQKEIEQKRKEFYARTKDNSKPFHFTPPNYDEEFERAMAIMDAEYD